MEQVWISDLSHLTRPVLNLQAVWHCDTIRDGTNSTTIKHGFVCPAQLCETMVAIERLTSAAEVGVPEGMHNFVYKGSGELEAKSQETRGIIGTWYPLNRVIRGLSLEAKYGEDIFVDQDSRTTTTESSVSLSISTTESARMKEEWWKRTYGGFSPGLDLSGTDMPDIPRSVSVPFSNALNLTTSFNLQILSHKFHNSSCVGFCLASNQ